MEKATVAKLLSVVIILITFVIGATQDELWNFFVYLFAGGLASVFIWLQPKTDLGDWTKLVDHLVLSLPLAGLAAITGAVVLYTPSTGFDFAKWLATAFLLMVPASVLEQRLMAE